MAGSEVEILAMRNASLREPRATPQVADAERCAPSEFIESLSRELRTSLNGVLGFAQLSLRDTKDPLPRRQQSRIAQIVVDGERLIRVFDAAITLSRIEGGSSTLSPEPANPVESIRDAIATLEPMAALANVRLERIACAEPAPTILVDRAQFAQILLKYGTNAIKHNHPGGCASFGFSVSDDHVRIAVVDTGAGVPERKREQLFEPFGGGGSGTGLGLSISKSLARRMGGSVGYQCVPSGGSEFWVEVPLHASSSRSGMRAAVSMTLDEFGSSLTALAPVLGDRGV